MSGRTASVQERCDALFNALAHGDEEHRQWLREAIEAYFHCRSIPAPRGSGNKEATISRLAEENARLLKALQNVETASAPWSRATVIDAADRMNAINGIAKTAINAGGQKVYP